MSDLTDTKRESGHGIEDLSSIRPGDSLADAAYNQLSERILRNQLPPGTSLSVPELSRRLGISRSPVREAVQRLIYDGLADYRGRRGTVVSSIEISDFVALLEVREVLEGLTARLAAQRATDEELARLEALHGEFLSLEPGSDPSESTPSEATLVEFDTSFHQLIREMSCNQELGIILARTQARAHLSMHTLWKGARNVEAVQSEHGEICAAILARDPNRADAAARDHIVALRHRVLSEVADREAGLSGEVATGETMSRLT